MTNYLKHETFETLTAIPYFKMFLTNEIARSTYCIGNIEVYKTEQGEYFYHHIMEDDEKEFVQIGEMELVNHMTPVPQEYQKLICILEKENQMVAPCGFHLVSIEYLLEQPTFVIQHKVTRHYFRLDHQSYKRLSLLTASDLKGKRFESTFAKPLKTILRNNGEVERVGELHE